MCGILFIQSYKNKICEKKFLDALQKQKYRGPDGSGFKKLPGSNALIGHTRLSIIGETEGDQPIVSENGECVVSFNGEIYNYEELNEKYFAGRKFSSDSRVLVELISLLGEKCLNELQGMFAFVAYNLRTKEVFAARDRFGIKPLYFIETSKYLGFASEPISLRSYHDEGVDRESLEEWKDIRRCTPGYTFFNGIFEIQPGHYWSSGVGCRPWYNLVQKNTVFNEEEFLEILSKSVSDHLIRDEKVDFTSLISGGVDSSTLAILSQPKMLYTTGIEENNEFSEVKDFIDNINIQAKFHSLTTEQFWSEVRSLVEVKDEPLMLPNEALIYSVCKSMPIETKVVLTGEGADEILFGYNKIFSQFNSSSKYNLSEFIDRYRYQKNYKLTRFKDYITTVFINQKSIHFIEDFFLKFHLPGLLRRADSAMMAAGKEGRVPFVTTALIEYCYRIPLEERWVNNSPKNVLRQFLKTHGFNATADREKLGFNARPLKQKTSDHYAEFYQKQQELISWL